jgi:hypothetical protein
MTRIRCGAANGVATHPSQLKANEDGFLKQPPKLDILAIV